MSLDVLHTAPHPSEFTSLGEHQEQTPDSYYDEKPVLHFYSPLATVRISRRDLDGVPDLQPLHDSSTSRSSSANGDTEIVEIPGIDIWVASK
jgi:chloride channel, nucleotide-sensitive, 1A